MRKIRKLFAGLSLIFILNGCAESMALLAPAGSALGSGNIVQSSITSAASFGVKKHTANLDVIYDPINNNNTKVSYLKQLSNFNLKLNSNYSLFSKIPDYGANIEISGTF